MPLFLSRNPEYCFLYFLLYHHAFIRSLDLHYTQKNMMHQNPKVTGFSAENSVKLTLLANRIVTNRVVEAQAFLNSSMKQGHEGIVAKALNSHYTPGTRGETVVQDLTR